MKEKIIRVVEESRPRKDIKYAVVETEYECGTHYVLMINDIPDFHSTDLERVLKTMYHLVNMYK